MVFGPGRSIYYLVEMRKLIIVVIVTTTDTLKIIQQNKRGTDNSHCGNRQLANASGRELIWVSRKVHHEAPEAPDRCKTEDQNGSRSESENANKKLQLAKQLYGRTGYMGTRYTSKGWIGADRAWKYSGYEVWVHGYTGALLHG